MTEETDGQRAQTVPATALATFVFLGLLRLGDQIEKCVPSLALLCAR